MPLLNTLGAGSARGFGGIGGGVVDPVVVNVETVFDTYLYDGNASSSGSTATTTISNGIDLAGEGGLVWIKSRTTASYGGHYLRTFSPDSGKLDSSWQGAQNNSHGSIATLSNGFELTGSSNGVNQSGVPHVSWTFRKAPKFFDVVTWSGDSNSQQVLSHNLGSDPGMVIIKSTNTNGTSWWVWHRSFGANTSSTGKQMALDVTSGVRNTGTIYTGSAFDWSSPNGATQQGSYVQGTSSTNITVGYEANNGSSWDYVAYLFAHNNSDGEFGPNGDQDIIKCGGYTGNGSTGQDINLGFEPQWLMVKGLDRTCDWVIIDSMRGVPVGGTTQFLRANSTAVEETSNWVDMVNFTSTGWKIPSGGPGSNVNELNEDYIYMAIRLST